MDRLMTTLTIFSLLVLVFVLASVRREHIRVEYSVSWLTAAFVLLVLSLNSSAVHWIAALFGISYPPLAILLVVFFVFFVVFYRFSLRISALKDANIALTQRLAILEFHLKSIDEQHKTANS